MNQIATDRLYVTNLYRLIFVRNIYLLNTLLFLVENLLEEKPSVDENSPGKEPSIGLAGCDEKGLMGESEISVGGAVEIVQRIGNLFAHGTLQNNGELQVAQAAMAEEYLKLKSNPTLLAADMDSEAGRAVVADAFRIEERRQARIKELEKQLPSLKTFGEHINELSSPSQKEEDDILDNFRTDSRTTTDAKIRALKDKGYDVSFIESSVEFRRAALVQERNAHTPIVRSSSNGTTSLNPDLFDQYISSILVAEGGFVNHPADHGGPTNKGITMGTFQSKARELLGIEPTIENLQNLTDDQAKTIYKNKYWDGIQASRINDPNVTHILFDMAINSGNTTAVRYMQMTLNSMGNNLALDGAVGPNTLNAINNANGRTLFNNFKNNRINFYNAIIRNDPSQEIFRAGWMNRINSINYH